MLTFDFEIQFYENQTEVDGLSLGNMTISDQTTTIFSESFGAMMIFISIAHLLAGVQQLLKVRKGRQFHFYGIDSSFSLKFFLSDSGLIKIVSPITTIDNIAQSELVASLWEGIRSFIARYQIDYTGANPESDNTEETIMSDFALALADFQQAFPELPRL